MTAPQQLPAPIDVGRLPDPAFWSGKRVLITGHTGFKGSWAHQWLNRLGATVTGLALPPETEPNLFGMSGLNDQRGSRIADLLDRTEVANIISEARPEIVLHMAAQPLVRRSYREPVETFTTNFLGTVNLLEALRSYNAPPRAIVVVTSDKVYLNDESGRPFKEDDRLGGHDPYAASKAATEIAAACYRYAYFAAHGSRVVTARGGNVIGGGDFSEDRIVPDIWRAAEAGQTLALRAPSAVRPWQHVLDCLSGYFAFAELVFTNDDAPSSLNIGPNPDPVITVGELADTIQGAMGVERSWRLDGDPTPKEMDYLSLDSSLAQTTLGWANRLPGRAGLAWTADWYARFRAGEHPARLCQGQIAAYSGV